MLVKKKGDEPKFIALNIILVPISTYLHYNYLIERIHNVFVQYVEGLPVKVALFCLYARHELILMGASP